MIGGWGTDEARLARTIMFSSKHELDRIHFWYGPDRTMLPKNRESDYVNHHMSDIQSDLVVSTLSSLDAPFKSKRKPLYVTVCHNIMY